MSKAAKPAGRKRSNYGVSIYQEAPVVIHRKRKATEISIVENGVRMIGGRIASSNPSVPAPAPTPPPSVGEPWHLTEPGEPWLGQVRQGVLHQGLPQPQPPLHQQQHHLQPADTGANAPVGGLPMRRTRSRGPADELPPAPAFRPTVSGLVEALGFDDPCATAPPLPPLPPLPG
eukprot:5808531-Prymnesium_polylepis.1